MEKNLFLTKGRINRTTYFIRSLIAVIIYYVAILILASQEPSYTLVASLMIIKLLFAIFIIIQGIKRAHDVGDSGWYFIIPVYNLIYFFWAGTPGANKFGENPKKAFLLVKKE
jgi:uncharacterized membrane protein YhaH (DUF805 family)